MAFPLTREGQKIYELSLKGGVLKKAELLEVLLSLEEMSENVELMRLVKKDEAIKLFLLIDKLSLGYFRYDDSDYIRALLLETAELVDRLYLKLIVHKYH